MRIFLRILEERAAILRAELDRPSFPPGAYWTDYPERCPSCRARLSHVLDGCDRLLRCPDCGWRAREAAT